MLAALGIMKDKFIVGIAAVMAAAVGGQAQMKRVTISDPAAGFGGVAMTLNIPADWKFEGTVLRRDTPCNWQSNGTMLPSFAYRASSPDGLTAIELLPSYEWHWSSLGGSQPQQCVIQPPMAPADVAKKVIIPKERRGAQVGQTSPDPEASQNVAEKVRKSNQESVAANRNNPFHTPPNRMSGDAARVHMEYNLNGRPVEEEVLVVSTSKEFPGVPPVGGTTWTLTYDCAANATFYRAPRGQLHSAQKMLLTILQSATLDPQWSRKEKVLEQQQFERSQKRKLQEAKDRTLAMENARCIGAHGTKDHMGDRQTPIVWQNELNGQILNLTYNPNGHNPGRWRCIG
jgi:hypothetical protein